MSLMFSRSRSESSGLFKQLRTVLMARDILELQFGEEGPTTIVLDDQQKDVNYRDIANCSIPVFSTPPVYQMSYVMESPILRGIPAKTAYKFIASGISSSTGRY